MTTVNSKKLSGGESFRERHDQYMDYIKQHAGKTTSSIFWDHLRAQFETRFIDGKATMIGEWGKHYDPRIGTHTIQIPLKDKIFLLGSKILDRLAQKAFDRVSESTRYFRAYQKLNFDDGLPPSSRLLSHKIFRVGDNCALHPHVIRMFSYLSQLYKHVQGLSSRDTVMEIGAGAGLLGILFRHEFGVRYVVVDLPEMIGFSSTMVENYLPGSRILLPHEVQSPEDLEDKDFVFLTPDQAHFIPESSVSLAINIHSFGEMKLDEIDGYFRLIQRVGKEDSLFFTENRYEKIPGYNDEVLRSFFHYPWKKGNEDIFIRISPFHQEIRHHLMITRLQKIRK